MLSINHLLVDPGFTKSLEIKTLDVYFSKQYQCTVNTLGTKLGNSTLKMLKMLEFRFFATFLTKIHYGEGYEAIFFMVLV